MKYYESHFEEYISAINRYNLHPEMWEYKDLFPKNIQNFGNLIVHGPSGVGKYSQILRILQKYSPSSLKYDKHMIMQTEKQTYTYKISDIHYEIDMALLGCNSKIVWHEIFGQIVDIVSMKSEKIGIILCKNFHAIHTELLDIFYSYMQQYNHSQLNIQIRFILITEHISFLSSRILDNCTILSVKRPSKSIYNTFIMTQDSEGFPGTNINKPPSSSNEIQDENRRRPPPPPPSLTPVLGQKSSVKRSSSESKIKNEIVVQTPISDLFVKHISRIQQTNTVNPIPSFQKYTNFLDNVEPSDILNIKEVSTIQLALKTPDKNMPKEIFNNVCDAIIHELANPKTIVITAFRDMLYDILIYNLDAIECLWYILTHFIYLQKLDSKDVSYILSKTYTFLKYYNNNYRPIYHLENIFLLLLTKLKQ